MARRVTVTQTWSPPFSTTGRRAALVVSVLATFGLLLSGCDTSSDTLGNQACTRVEHSITLFEQSMKSSGAAAKKFTNEANTELRLALRPASLAASGDGDWQALAATLSESSRVGEGNLVQALSDECAASPAGPRPT